MLSEAVKRVPDDLDGLPLAEVFRRYVIEDGQVAAIGRRMSEARPSNSTVFVEGQFPGAFVDFHWPLHVSAESIAYAFVSSPVTFLDKPLPTPSELVIAASELLADRIAALIGGLARREIIAVGTFAATGIEGPVGSGQWTRTDLVIDVENSAICEIRDHRPVALWTGVCLQPADRRPPNDQIVPSQPDAEQPKARKQIQTKNRTRSECIDWLTSLISDPAGLPLTNDELWAEVRTRWPNKVGKRGYEKCRTVALSRVSEEQRELWCRPGPKRRSPQF